MIHTLDLRGWACLEKSWIVGRVASSDGSDNSWIIYRCSIGKSNKLYKDQWWQ